MRFLLLFFILTTSSFTLLAQKPIQKGVGLIDGQILDSTRNVPIEYAMIRLFNVADSSIVSGIYTDENGNFILEEVPNGSFYIQVETQGYITKRISKIQISPTKQIRKLGKVALVSDEKTIEEVVISQDKEQLKIGLDKKVYNVGDDISVVGGSVNDVLNNVPSVEIDQDGVVSLRGSSNVTILIDGKPSALSGGNAKAILDGIPAGSIERVEIVTNPSARYDPDGTSGIINIVLKKNIKRGLNGTVSASAGTGDLYTANASLSMRNTKFNVYGNYAYSHREGYRNNFSDLTQNFQDSLMYLNQRRLGDDYQESHTAKIGMDIYLKDRNTLSWNVSGNMGDRNRSGDQYNLRASSLTDTLAFWNRRSFDPSQNKNLDFGLNYTWDFKNDNGSLNLSGYESLSNEDTQGFYYQDTITPVSTSPELNQRLFSTDNNAVTTLQLDYVRILKNNWRTEGGLKMIHRNQDVSTRSDRLQSSGDYTSDTLAYFDYSYSERIYSAYGIAAGVKNKWKYQVGLRFEQSYQIPNLISTNQKVVNNYFNVFPSGTLRYAISKKSEFSLGYSKRINRASSGNLNPFTSYADPYNLRRGNPYLKPEFIHSIDLGYETSWKIITVTASVYQRFTNHVIQRVKEFYADGTSAGTFANIDKSMSTGGELVLQIKPLPNWRNTLSANGNYIKYIDASNTANYNREGFVFSTKIASTLELMKKTLILQVNGRYSAPSVSAQGKFLPRGSVDFSADKSFKGDKWGVGLRVTDIFNTQGFQFDVEQPSLSQTSEFKWETRRLIVSVRYKFGKTELIGGDKKGGGEGGGGFDF